MNFYRKDKAHNGQSERYDTTAHNSGLTMGDAAGKLGNILPYSVVSAYLARKARRVSGSGGVKVVSMDMIAEDITNGQGPFASWAHERRAVGNFLIEMQSQGQIRLGKLGSRDVVFIDVWLAI